MRALAGVLALCGCGDNLADHDVHGGARLQLVTYVYEDGTREWDREELYDAARAERCHPARFSDGGRYCMPVAAGAETVFVDAACSLSLGSEAPDVPPPTYFVRTFELDGVTLPSRLYRGGARVDPPAQIWEQIDGSCLGASTPTQRWYYELTEEIRPSALVRIRESSVLDGSRLAVGIDTSDDGLRVPGALYDRDLELACTPARRANAPTTPCVPDELPSADYYADAACSEPVVALPPGTTGDVARHHARATGCSSLRSVGDAIAPSLLYVQLDGACVAVQPPSGFTLYADGGELPIATANRLPRAAGTRLAPIDLVDGPVQVPDGFLADATLGAECRRQQVGDAHVCVPHAAVTARPVFADPQCSGMLLLAFVPAGACHPPARFATDGDAIYPIGAPYTETFYELEPGDRCGTFAAPPGFSAHALAPALPSSAFARATLEISE